MSKVKIYSLYDKPLSVGITFEQPSMTEQHHLVDCDINNILAKYQDTGVVKQRTDANYGDFTIAPNDFLEAQQCLIDASDMFSKLPARVRDRFANDPYELLSFVADEANRDEAVQLGLLASVPQASDTSSKTEAEKPAE